MHLNFGLGLLLLLLPNSAIKPVRANNIEYITDKNALLETIAEVESGHSKTIYIDKINYSGPILFNIEDKNITIVGKDSNSGFVNSTTGCIMVKASTDVEKTGSITFENVSFRTELEKYNPESSYLSTMLYGLKIDSGNIDVSINNCEFSGFRYGKGSGGAIQVIYSVSKNQNYKTNISINNSKFTDNVSISGGAIYAVGTNNVNLEIENSEFSGNYSSRGAIFLEGANAKINNSKFTENGDFKEYVVSDLIHTGSAIYSANSVLQLSNSLFSKNNGNSTFYLEKSNAFVSDNTISENDSSLTCLLIRNSGTKLVTFFNNLFDSNTNVYERYFNCDKEDTNYETELRSKFYFNTFNNAGIDQSINNEHACSFANLFINPSIANPTFPKSETNYNTFLDDITKVDANIDNMVISNDVIKEHLKMFDHYIGTFFASKNKFTQQINVDGETINVDSLIHKDKFGFDFENYYYNGTIISEQSKLLVSSIGNNTIVVKYKLNTAGVMSFIVGPATLILLIPLVIYMTRLIIRKKKEVIQITGNSKAIEISKETTSCLTTREIEVLNLLLEGKERKQIANELFVSESTVKKHITSIYTKLDVKNRIELFNKIKKI